MNHKQQAEWDALKANTDAVRLAYDKQEDAEVLH